MIEPISKLPWNNDNDIEVLLDADNGGVGHEFYEQDVKYIVQACNNFPKAIELLQMAQSRCLPESSISKWTKF